jgi:hypothetical protein
MTDFQSIREILEGLAASNEHTRDEYLKWRVERDRVPATDKKPPATEPARHRPAAAKDAQAG